MTASITSEKYVANEKQFKETQSENTVVNGTSTWFRGDGGIIESKKKLCSNENKDALIFFL